MATLKLSEAIRLGSMLRPQAFGALRGRRWFGVFGQQTSCALGAAHEAAGCGTKEIEAFGASTPFRGNAVAAKAGKMHKVRVVEEPPEWNVVTWTRVVCPMCDNRPSEPLYRLIPHLNDDHRWSRDLIADFVANVEDSIGAGGSAEVGVERTAVRA